LRIGFEKIPVFAGVMLFAAGSAIILSTGNTFLMVTATNLSNDILKPYFIKSRDPKVLIRVQQVSIVILGLLAYVMVTQFETVLEMAFISYTMIGASLAPVLMASFFWKRVTPIGGVCSILAGMIVPVINKAIEVSDISLWVFPVDTDYIAIPSLVASLFMLIVVSFLTKPSPEEKWKPFFE
jgi:SSS family solute:Na+ symporter/sodium/proline symporter